MKLYRSCAALLTVILVAGCGGGGGSSSGSGGGGGAPIPVVTPTSSASTVPTNEAAYTCPTSDTASASYSRQAVSAIRHGRLPGRIPSSQPQQQTTALVAVSYDRATATASASHRLLAASEARAGGTFHSEYDFPRLDKLTRVLSVPVAQLAQTEAALRAQPGVLDVGLTGGKRYPLSVSAPYYTNDPYFQGFTADQTGGDAATFQLQPLVENANVPGQWGAHKTQLDFAFAYSQPNNGSGIQNVAALGSSSIKIAIIDTGADLTQPDLAPKVTLQRCFITGPNGQSTSNFVTDPDGHGTDVSGIAGAVPNNAFGFTGEGGASVLYEYRVNPTPDAKCFTDPPSSTDDLCTATTTDVAAAINDAVARGVNVISMSLGGGVCTTAGQDPDPNVEGRAVANAIASNVIVVAAAGNGGAPDSPDTRVTAPGCDSGVIAVGASALADGAANGSGNSNGSSVAPSEYVASYSSFGSPAAAFRNVNAWGIVAPGGDPNGSGDQDALHWINNLWTSTPSVTADSGTCGADYANTGPAAECQVFIAGTSMATPVVAGAAALILAVNPSYRVPAAMKQLLCTTTDDISAAHEGCGRLNVYRAMATALGDTVLPTAVKVRRP